MNPEAGSIMKYFHSLFPVKIYTKEVPKNFEVPSLFFPAPTSSDDSDTNMTFSKAYSLSVKLFHQDSIAANIKADFIADDIRSQKNVIPMLGPSGELTGDFIRMSRIETRIGDRGVATIVLTWESKYRYKREEWPVLQSIEINSEVK